MKSAFLVIVSITSIWALPTAQINGRIWGGDAISIYEARYQTTVQLNRQHICGGTIVSDKVIVTAAHCTEGLSATNVTIRVKSSVADWGEEYFVSEIVQHKRYNSQTRENDISKLLLVNPLDMYESGGAWPAVLPPRNSDYSDIYGYVTGWGSNDVNAINLMGVYVQIRPREDCRKYYNSKFVNGMLCTGDVVDGQRSVCDGDDGGPLVVGDTLVGIVSWGMSCGSRSHPPTVYIDVSAYIDFIID